MISSESIGLLFRAKGDTSDAKKSFGSLKDSIKKDAGQIKTDVGDASADSEKSLGGLTKATEALSTGFEVASTVAGVAVTAIAAVGIAAAAVGKQLFDMARGAGEAAVTIDKFQKLTSLSTDTIQALKAASEQAGSSIEDIEETWESFSELMVKAARGEADAINQLKRSGIDHKEAMNDLEGTYAKALKLINEATPGLKQNAVAMDLFGESGLRMINVARAMDGDLSKFTQTLKENGVIMDSAGIRKAKEFDLQIKALGQQFTGLKNNIGVGVMPEIIKLGNTASKFIKDNQRDIIQLGRITATVFGDIFNAIGRVLARLQTYRKEFESFINFVANFDPVTAAAIKYGENIRGRLQQADVVSQAEQAAQANFEAQLGDTTPTVLKDPAEETKKQQEELKKRLAEFGEANKLQLESLRQTYEASQKAWADSLEKGELSFDDYKKGILDNIEEFARASRELLAQGFAIDSEGKTGQELANARQAYQNALAGFNNEIARQKEELGKKQIETEKKATEEQIKAAETKNNRLIELERSRAETDLAQKEDLKNKGIITEKEYASAVALIKLNSLEYEKKLLQDSLEGLDKKSEKYAETTQKIALLDQALTRQQIENARAVETAIENLTVARDDLSAAIFRGSQGNEGEEGQSPDVSAPGSPQGLFGGLVAELKEFFRLGEALPTLAGVFTEFAGILTNAFSGIANAVGSVVENWVLMGDTGPAMFRKIVAAALASIAAESAVRAIFELAKGFAALFFNPAEAAAHFTAAALFGSIAVGSALAGRAVAGDAFKRQTAGGYGSSTSTAQDAGQGGDIYSANRDKQIINLSRNMSASVPEQQIVIRDKSGLFGEFFTLEVLRNGKVRDVIRKTAQD